MHTIKTPPLAMTPKQSNELDCGGNLNSIIYCWRVREGMRGNHRTSPKRARQLLSPPNLPMIAPWKPRWCGTRKVMLGKYTGRDSQRYYGDFVSKCAAASKEMACACGRGTGWWFASGSRSSRARTTSAVAVLRFRQADFFSNSQL